MALPGTAASGLPAGAITASTIAADALTNAKIADDAISEEQFDIDACANMLLGKEIVRATAVIPQTTTTVYFTIAGGRVMVKSIVGEATAVIQDTGAVSIKFISTPTTGTAADLCAALDIANDEQGTLYTITGTIGDAMLGVSAGGSRAQDNGIILNVGTLDLDGSASKTGNIKWTIHYVPIDAGATLVATGP